MHILEIILNILFPSSCIFCGKYGKDVCENCVLSSPLNERECASWIFPIFDYRHIVIKKSIWFLKYKGKKKIAEIFAEIMYGKIMEELSDLSQLENFKNPILIPIPLSKKRFRERGYNQAELICKKLVKLSSSSKLYLNTNETKRNDFVFEKNILIKIKETEHQAMIKNKNKRLQNLAGTFSVKDKSKIENKNIILIDDVLTTGATLSEAKKILKENGAKKIIAFTVAH